jgi:hypothetical protein
MNDIIDAFYDKPLQEMASLSTCSRTTGDYVKLMDSVASFYRRGKTR